MGRSRHFETDQTTSGIPVSRGWALAVFTLLFLLGASAASGEPGPVDPSAFERIDGYLAGRMAKYGIPGMAVAIVGVDGVLHARGYGRADPSGRPVTPQTPFVIGSVSKPFTALAIMQLAESGRLEIDDPIVAYLPWFGLAGGAGSEMTVRQLLYQRSGIGTEAEWQVAATNGVDSLDDLVRKMAALRPEGSPGSRYRYSNANYLILGRIVEAVSGMPYGEYLRRYIFEPLGMSHSYVSQQEAQGDGLARGYVSCFGLPRPSPVPYRNDFAPGAYVISCAEDMTRFLSVFMNGGALGSVRLLSAEGIGEMLLAAEDSPYGMGWFVGSANVYHGGSTIDYLAKVNILLDRGIGSVLLCNTSDNTATILFGAGYRDIVESDMLSILFGYDEEVGRLGDPPGYRVLAAVQIGLALVLLGLLALSVFRLVFFRRRIERVGTARLVAGTLLVNAVLPAAILVGPPLAVRASWPVLFYHYRDLASVALAVAVLLLAEGLVKAGVAVASRMRSAVEKPGAEAV